MSRRKVLEAPGVPRHGAPIPAGVRIGNLVLSSAIGGHDPVTGKLPDEPAAQVANAFRHLKALIDSAGGSTDDIAKVTVYLKDMAHRELVNIEWLLMFPHEDDRPVRHAIKTDLAGGMAVQLEFIAALG